MKHCTATKHITILLVLIVSILLSSCASAADIASANLSKDADQFKVNRQIVFYNGITGGYIQVIEGMCSLGNNDAKGTLSITCLVGKDESNNNLYYKHFLGLSDNVTYFVIQKEGFKSDPYHYKVIVRPEQIIPYLELDTSAKK